MNLFALKVLVSLLYHQITVNAFQDCPLLGPVFPAPTNLASSPSIQNATAALKAAIDDAIATGALETNFTTFSVEIFSSHDPSSFFEFHSAAPILASSPGTKSVDSNSIYRIGSISKLFTVYLFLIEAGDIHFNEPVTKYVPELAAVAGKARDDPVSFVDWQHVTIGNLASQLSGIGRDYTMFGEILQGTPPGADLSALLPYGLPPLNASEYPPCSFPNICDRQQFFAGFTKRHPVYVPSQGPIYSNAAYQILAYALESIMDGRPYEKMLQEKIFDTLGLSGTSCSQPSNDSLGVIPINATTSGWDNNIGDESPAGSIYSTTADMSKLGRSILNSALLNPAQTRRWMKPLTHTSSLTSSVGAPWEILRMTLPEPSRVLDLYTKNGGIGVYSSEFGLIPDWDIGFIILQAGSSSGDWLIISELIASIIAPAVEAAAREQADLAYSGTYTSSNPLLNSSIIISTSPTEPGLGVTHWISNGSDMITTLSIMLLGASAPSSNISVRLYPTNLKTATAGGTEVAWRGVVEEITSAPNTIGGLFSFSCFEWASVDANRYGMVAFDDFVFSLDSNGTAVSTSPRVLRVVLDKK